MSLINEVGNIYLKEESEINTEIELNLILFLFPRSMNFSFANRIFIR